MRLDPLIDARVWKEDGKWWAQRFDNGRCTWLAYGFKSSHKAKNAIIESEYAEVRQLTSLLPLGKYS